MIVPQAAPFSLQPAASRGTPVPALHDALPIVTAPGTEAPASRNSEPRTGTLVMVTADRLLPSTGSLKPNWAAVKLWVVSSFIGTDVSAPFAAASRAATLAAKVLPERSILV